MTVTMPRCVEPDPEAADLRPAAAFALFDGQPTVFCEAAQALYRLNPVAALIWRGLDEGGVAGARAALTEAGLDASLAARHVNEAVEGWLRLGLLRLNSCAQTGANTFLVDGAAYSFSTPRKKIRDAIAQAFPAETKQLESPAAQFQLIEFGDSLHMFRKGRSVGRCDPDEVAPAAKALVIADILARDRTDILLHAACLSRKGRALLLNGEPGAGKTTLSLRLTAKNFGYCGDDIALIAPNGHVCGLPFPPTVKSGAWSLFPGLKGEVHRRPDGQEVIYAALDGGDHASRPVGWIVFLRRQAGAPKFLSVDRVEALRRIIAGAHAPGRRLTLTGFATLRRILAEAATVELVYGCAAEAADALCDFCDGP
ncbi:hypothetical protein M2323_004363 [Rhodoblastus acidophilus]|uniref:PqqD family peptide modification chaperone n=1 Tax=Rhodoblastus acidophilus TaxID=1074 RepID=UPI002224FCA2|nr:PqqD family peptide modification chaperone [Rhodoblastus acidophilus]MCW2286566.1 hypothetical protein [Rhodoblastus acidophilus]MCW2335415.1 hypothetical protein [Rhodoblastus acidophilus]